MFPTSRVPRPLLRALDVALEFATLGEVRLEPGWEEPAWLGDEGLRREWFMEEASPVAASPRAVTASATLRPATAAGRRVRDTTASPADRPREAAPAARGAHAERSPSGPASVHGFGSDGRLAACAGARGTAVHRDAPTTGQRRQRGGSVPTPPQPCLWRDV